MSVLALRLSASDPEAASSNLHPDGTVEQHGRVLRGVPWPVPDELFANAAAVTLASLFALSAESIVAVTPAEARTKR